MVEAFVVGDARVIEATSGCANENDVIPAPRNANENDVIRATRNANMNDVISAPGTANMNDVTNTRDNL